MFYHATVTTLQWKFPSSSQARTKVALKGRLFYGFDVRTKGRSTLLYRPLRDLLKNGLAAPKIGRGYQKLYCTSFSQLHGRACLAASGRKEAQLYFTCLKWLCWEYALPSYMKVYCASLWRLCNGVPCATKGRTTVFYLS